MPNYLFDLDIEEISGVDVPANARKFLIIKRAGGNVAKEVTAEELAQLPENVQALIKDLTTKAETNKSDDEAKGLLAKIKALFKGEPDPEPDDVVKDASPDVKRAYDAMKKLAEGAEAQAKQALEKLEKNELIELAKSFPHLGPVDDVVGELLVIKRNVDEKAWTAYLKRQRGLAAQLKDSGLFKALGAGDAGSDTPEDKLQTIAKGLRDKDPKLTKAQAYVMALDTDEGRAAYAEHDAQFEREV